MIYLLFLGNSYTMRNDLDIMVEGLLREGDPAYAQVDTTRLAAGGLAFPDHVERASSDPVWEEALVTGNTAWRWGILQDQSQIPGFYGEDAMWETSADAGEQLNGWLEAKGGGTVLLLTWGRRDGDSSNPQLYPDFLTMQDQLTEGYLAYQSRMSRADRPVWVAPAGLAFAAVYAADQDPSAPDSLFYRLYDADGSHPSAYGSWLAACTLYSTLTGRSAEGLTPPAQVDSATANQLAEVAWTVVSTGQGGLDYPWEPVDHPDSGDSGTDSGLDSAADSAEDLDSRPEDSGAGADSDGRDSNEEEGCGCGGNSSAAFLFSLLALSGRRRRMAA
ncbi:MAG TPA: hypothetical protein PLA94_20270 [Myxococcota bacterium]|nr:hypothetical protein [Myxococcota bacterium]